MSDIIGSPLCSLLDSPLIVLVCALVSMHIGPWSRWIFLKIRLMEDTLCVKRQKVASSDVGLYPVSYKHAWLMTSLTLGTLEALHMRAAESRFRISQANMVGFSLLHWTIVEMTPGVSRRGRLPPMVLGSRSPVRLYRLRILLTHPLDT